MVLSDREIWEEIRNGGLKFTPDVEPSRVSPSAVDLRLGYSFTTFTDLPRGTKVVVDLGANPIVEDVVAKYGDTQILQEGGTLELAPGQFILAYTLESIEIPNYLAARVEGRSSLARFGISIHQTAPTVHPTFKGQLRLEISNTGPFFYLLHPGLKICQLVLERLGLPAETILDSQFQDQQA